MADSPNYAEQFRALLTDGPSDPHRPRVLIFGEYGSGKTSSLRTLTRIGFEIACLQTEPTEILDDLPKGSFYRHYIAPGVGSWQDLKGMSQNVRDLTFKGLSDLVDPQKKHYDQWFDVINSTANFVDDRTGTTLGNVSDWPSNRVFVLDSLTGMTKMVQKLVCGLRPTIQLHEYTMIQETLGGYLEAVITTTTCPVVLIAHQERETDEATGQSKMMLSTLGKKLAPRLPQFFSDVIHSYTAGKDFYWSTATPGVATKNRNLPLSDKLPQDFAPIFQRYLERRKAGEGA